MAIDSEDPRDLGEETIPLKGRTKKNYHLSLGISISQNAYLVFGNPTSNARDVDVIKLSISEW